MLEVEDTCTAIQSGLEQDSGIVNPPSAKKRVGGQTPGLKIHSLMASASAQNINKLGMF
jgi:hypothetical protein